MTAVERETGTVLWEASPDILHDRAWFQPRDAVLVEGTSTLVLGGVAEAEDDGRDWVVVAVDTRTGAAGDWLDPWDDAASCRPAPLESCRGGRLLVHEDAQGDGHLVLTGQEAGRARILAYAFQTERVSADVTP